MTFIETPAAENAASKNVQARTAARLPEDFSRLINDAEALLRACGSAEAADNLRRAVGRAAASAFKLAVVGEFKRGKSAFVNRFLERELTPVNVLPATALVTNICSRPEEGLFVLDAKGKIKEKRPLKLESWQGLTIKPDASQELEGSVRLEVRSDILQDLGIELIDTPGAGDLDSSRESAVDRALLGGDGAIIAVSAKSAMSLSEKAFVTERLLSRHTPYLLLTVTFLDTVDEADRPEVLAYIKGKLAAWQRELKTDKDIPIFIPADIKVPGGEWDNFIGMDKIYRQIRLWSGDKNRTRLLQEYLCGLACAYLNTALEIKKRQKAERDCADAEKRAKLLRERQLQLDKEELRLAGLTLEWDKRLESCLKEARSLIEKHAQDAADELEYSASQRVADLKKWHSLDRPHLLKKLNAVLISRLNVLLANRLRGDLTWFSGCLSGKPSVSAELQLTESVFEGTVASADDRLVADNDPGKMRKLAQIGIGAATVGGLALVSLLNVALAPITVTVGVGTAGKILVDKLLSKKSDDLLEALKQQIRLETPELFKTAGREVEEKIKAVYASVFADASGQERERIAALRPVSDAAAASQSAQNSGNLETVIAKLESAADSLRQYCGNKL